MFIINFNFKILLEFYFIEHYILSGIKLFVLFFIYLINRLKMDLILILKKNYA